MENDLRCIDRILQAVALVFNFVEICWNMEISLQKLLTSDDNYT